MWSGLLLLAESDYLLQDEASRAGNSNTWLSSCGLSVIVLVIVVSFWVHHRIVVQRLNDMLRPIGASDLWLPTRYAPSSTWSVSRQISVSKDAEAMFQADRAKNIANAASRKDCVHWKLDTNVLVINIGRGVDLSHSFDASLWPFRSVASVS